MRKKVDPTAKHIIADLYGCDLRRMISKKGLSEMIKKATDKGKMDLILFKIQKFGTDKKPGYSGFAFLLQSHISFHCWDEYRFSQVDIFTCGRKSKPEEALRVIVDYFQPQKIRKISFDRTYREKD